MGRVKDRLIEEEERGWQSRPGKFVCPECVGDEYLKQVIRDDLAAPACDYCGLTAEELTGEKEGLIAAHFDSLMKVIAAGLYSEWNNADDEGIMYESSEGGYQAETSDSYDLVWEYVCPNTNSLSQEIVGALPDHPWVRRNYYSLSRDESLWFGWENFCEVVKHQNRYMFHLRGRKASENGSTASGPAHSDSRVGELSIPKAAEPSDANHHLAPQPNSTALRFGIPFQIEPENVQDSEFEEAIAEAQEGVSASHMLDEIGVVIEEVDLIKSLPAGTTFFRGRIGPNRKVYRSAHTLGPPPPHKARANRMSPAGIPMFYGASDEHTAIAETLVARLKRGEGINVGAFTTLEDFYVLDLTNLGPVPSIFSELRYLRPSFKFLRSFVRDLSKPVKRDGREHIEYVPTQIVTEYFRHSFQWHDGEPIRGILYPSSKNRGGIACVLFFTPEECAISRARVQGISRKQRLAFIRNSGKKFRRKPSRPRIGSIVPR